MKRSHLKGLLLTVMMLWISLIPSQAQSRGNLIFQTKQWQHEYTLSNSAFSPKYRHEIKISYATSGDQKVKDFVNEVIATTVLGQKYNNMPTTDAVNAYLNDKTQLYIKDTENDYYHAVQHTATPTRDLVRRYSYSMKFTTQLLTYWNTILSFEFTWFDSKYGSNGLIGSKYVNIDLYNFTILTYPDIFIKDSKKQLMQCITKHLLDYFSAETVEDVKELGADISNIEPAEKFVMEPKGIRFIYEPYELNSNATGNLELTIPYSEIKDLLNTNNTTIRMIIPRA